MLEHMLPSWEWQVLTLPARHFSWRIRGNPLYWSVVERATLEKDYDLLIATSMVDLATLRGLIPSLAALPTVYYFHENQFAYPVQEGGHSLLEAQMVSLYGAMAADSVVFNSRYNQESFFDGLGALLSRLPDYVPTEALSALLAKSTILPVPIKPDRPQTEYSAGYSAPSEPERRPLRLLWIGRFEYDKGAEGLLYTLRALRDRGTRFELALIGQQFRHSPLDFDTIEDEFSSELVQFGFVEGYENYQQWLSAADIVLSTAIHEFQGLAILEAVALGCVPVVPDRLAYAELYPDLFRYHSCPQEPAREIQAAVSLIEELAALILVGEVTPPDVSVYAVEALQPRYESLFAGLTG
ncbi:MAG: glycosyltransferase involved in cell wall biosynthesis [Alcanivorax sp.]|jgi:glycosyltransferase involved in cell wall biosynthesis